MAKVEVDDSDLETLIFATSVLKTIEGALISRKSDPFVRPHLDYTRALDNVTTAWRNSKRTSAGTAIAWDGELDSFERDFLKSICGFECSNTITVEYRLNHPEIDRLAAKGCIQLGQCCEGAVWAGENTPDIRPIPKFAVRVTPRGIEKFKELTK